MDYISEVVKRVQLKEGDYIIEKFLSIVYFYGPISTKELSNRLFLPIPITTAIKKEFIKLNILEQMNGIRLTKLGVRYVLNDGGYAGLNEDLYCQLMQDTSKQEECIQELCEEHEEIFNNRPMVDVTIDQAKCTIETSFRRALLCLENYCLIKKRILCVGDDDFVSVALALLLKKLFPDTLEHKASICVFEIDERYIVYLNTLISKYQLPIQCVQIDIKDPLPLSVSNSFDCFFTDPPYTTKGLSLFLSRGVSALKKKKGLKVFLSYGQKQIEESFQLQECILSHGFFITSIKKSFNEYEGASLLGNVSQMLILESTEKMRAVIPSALSFDSPIYTRENKAPNSSYICKNCKQQISLDQNSDIHTIEELKHKGCPSCGGKQFDLQRKKVTPPQNTQTVKNAFGEHILADFYNCNKDVLNNLEQIKSIMHEAAQKAKATIVFEDFHMFSPWGVSGAVIIMESHLTIHTWPEHGYAAVDLFTCGDSLNIWEAFEYIKIQFESHNVEFNDISRGILGTDDIVL